MAFCRTTIHPQPQRCQEKTGLDTRAAFKSQEQGERWLLSSSSQTLPLDHSPLCPGMDGNLCEGEAEASTHQENASSRLAQDASLPGPMCVGTLPSPRPIFQLFVPCGATSGCCGYLNWNQYSCKTQCPPRCSAVTRAAE